MSAGLSARRIALLAEMGITVWQQRQPDADADAAVAAVPVATRQAPATPPAEDFDPSVADWDTLHASIRRCQRCELGQTRTHAVCGTGSRIADWLIIGEAPGADEDASGEPFVGRAGQLLTEMLRAAGLQRDQVFIANILKCRPPNNRNPFATEVQQCRPYLQRQIALLQPRIILAMGATASQNLLQVSTEVGKLRGHVHSLELGDRKVPVIVTYHPAYLLRSPLQKSLAWADLLLAMDVAAGTQS